MSKEYYHNKGETDASEGKYNPPHYRVEDLIRDIVAGQPKKDAEDIKSYDQGHHHTKSQKG